MPGAFLISAFSNLERHWVSFVGTPYLKLNPEALQGDRRRQGRNRGKEGRKMMRTRKRVRKEKNNTSL